MQSDSSQPGVVVSRLSSKFTEEVAAQIGVLDLAHCFQCGVCSGSCPTMARMQYGPRRILHMVRLGMADKVLASNDLWMCVSCYSCAARCPQGIQITDVMATLRNMAIARNVAKDKEAAFSRVFVDVIQRHGRMFEPEVLMRYYAAQPDLAGLLMQAGLGLSMIRKGKISLRPERIENAEEIAEMVARIGEGEER